jgi:glycosyltransferase involved in cell wall biosynthesis
VTTEVAVITGCTRPRLLDGLYTSLQAQIVDWRWFVQLDGDAIGWASGADLAWANDPRVSIAANAKPSGSGTTRNSALMRSSSSLVMCVDDDDELQPDALGPLVTALSDHPTCFGAWGQTHTFTVADPTDVPFKSWERQEVIAPGIIGERFAAEGHMAVHVGSVLWRRSHLVAMGGYSALPRSIDTNPFIACQALFPHVYVDHPVYRYRLHDEQMTRADHYVEARNEVHSLTHERERELKRLLRPS